MKSLILYLLLLFTTNNNIWLQFVSEPIENNFVVCKKQVKKSLSKKMYGKESPVFKQLEDPTVFGKLLDLVEDGNVYAAELCFLLFPIYEGWIEQIEFFDISLGKFMKKKPEIFLSLYDRYKNYCCVNLETILCNFGDEFVDDIEKQIDETKSRIKILRDLRNTKHHETKIQCIEILEKELRFLKNIRDSRKNEIK